MITLFLKIYKNKKDLFSKLIEIFYEDNEKENTDWFKWFKKKVKSFSEIYDKASDFLEENNNNLTPFLWYFILLSSLYYYGVGR